jgi:hypothetical protein
VEKDSQIEGVSSASDFIKVSTSLATGGLVFGVAYFSNITPLSWQARLDLAWAVGLFVVSAALGLAASSRIPIMIADKRANVRDGLLSVLGACHQITFVVGLILVARVLNILSSSQPPVDDFKMATAGEAVEKARQVVGRGLKVRKVDTTELIHGVDAGAAKLNVWHVRFLLAAAKRDSQQYVDVFLSSESGTVLQHIP